MKRRHGLTLALALLMTACASSSIKPHAAQAFWSGRMGLQVDSKPPQSLQAGFELQGSAQAGELLLLTPLGGTLARLHWQAGQAVLERGSERWQAEDPSSLGQQLAQTPLPIEALFAWLQGEAMSADGWTPNLERWSEGRIRVQRLQPEPAAVLNIVFER